MKFRSLLNWIKIVELLCLALRSASRCFWAISASAKRMWIISINAEILTSFDNKLNSHYYLDTPRMKCTPTAATGFATWVGWFRTWKTWWLSNSFRWINYDCRYSGCRDGTCLNKNNHCVLLSTSLASKAHISRVHKQLALYDAY